MAKFIGVTDYDNEKLLVNVDNILWFKAYEKEHAIIYMAAPDQKNYPASLIVKESRDTIMKYIINVAKMKE